MKKNFFIWDSHFTMKIGETILENFPQSRVFVSLRGSNPSSKLQKLVELSDLPLDHEKEINHKIDFFIVSARLIAENRNMIANLKEQHGHAASIFIAVSADPQYLNEVKDCVTHSANKADFMVAESITCFFEEVVKN